MRLPRNAVLGLTLAFFAASCGGANIAAVPTGTPSTSAAQPATTSAPTTTTTEAPVAALDFSQLGPHTVGRRTVELVDGVRDDRPVTIEVWYPATDGGESPSQYVFLAPLQYLSAVALDAPLPAESARGFPTVVYSHGNNGFGWVHGTFAEHLASHGFVVVAPAHAGNTLLDSIFGSSRKPDEIARLRRSDVDYVWASLAEHPLLAWLWPIVDLDHTAIVGHSFGGWTALDHAASPGGAATIDAVVAFAPAVAALSDDQLGAIAAPTLIITASQDLTVPPSSADRVLEFGGADPTYLAEIIGGGHMTFSDVCLFVETLNGIPAVPQDFLDLADSYAAEACIPELIDVAVAHRAINHLVTAFLVEHVLGETTNSITAAGLEAVTGDVFLFDD